MSFYYFKGSSNAWWAFKQMRLAHTFLSTTKGLKFYKLLGSGSGDGFSIFPDFNVFALLQVWDSRQSESLALQADWFKDLAERREGHYNFELEPYVSRGSWSGEQPFKNQEVDETELMAVITRARIKSSQLFAFWRSVPEVSKHIKTQKSLLYQKGIGEWPLIEQATFSVWNREEAMKDFAYKQKAHREVVKKTRERQWYSEEQFTRFMIPNHYGVWPTDEFQKILEL